jgi:hypothetical protein
MTRTKQTARRSYRTDASSNSGLDPSGKDSYNRKHVHPTKAPRNGHPATGGCKRSFAELGLGPQKVKRCIAALPSGGDPAPDSRDDDFIVPPSWRKPVPVPVPVDWDDLHLGRNRVTRSHSADNYHSFSIGFPEVTSLTSAKAASSNVATTCSQQLFSHCPVGKLRRKR